MRSFWFFFFWFGCLWIVIETVVRKGLPSNSSFDIFKLHNRFVRTDARTHAHSYYTVHSIKISDRSLGWLLAVYTVQICRRNQFVFSSSLYYHQYHKLISHKGTVTVFRTVEQFYRRFVVPTASENKYWHIQYQIHTNTTVYRFSQKMGKLII